MNFENKIEELMVKYVKLEDKLRISNANVDEKIAEISKQEQKILDINNTYESKLSKLRNIEARLRIRGRKWKKCSCWRQEE